LASILPCFNGFTFQPSIVAAWSPGLADMPVRGEPALPPKPPRA
jgi:hypothetical protein